MKRKRAENDSVIERVNCYLKGFEAFGIFVANSLYKKYCGDVSKLRNMVRPGSKLCKAFSNDVSRDLENFLAQNDFSIEGWVHKYMLYYYLESQVLLYQPLL